MNSHNHPMFGSLGAWFYNALAGINLDAAKPGFERVAIAPQVVRDLKWAAGSVDTIRGTVASSWSRSDNGLRLEVTIPVGGQAEVRIPELGLRRRRSPNRDIRSGGMANTRAGRQGLLVFIRAVRR